MFNTIVRLLSINHNYLPESVFPLLRDVRGGPRVQKGP